MLLEEASPALIRVEHVLAEAIVAARGLVKQFFELLGRESLTGFEFGLVAGVISARIGVTTHQGDDVLEVTDQLGLEALLNGEVEAVFEEIGDGNANNGFARAGWPFEDDVVFAILEGFEDEAYGFDLALSGLLPGEGFEDGFI